MSFPFFFYGLTLKFMCVQWWFTFPWTERKKSFSNEIRLVLAIIVGDSIEFFKHSFSFLILFLHYLTILLFSSTESYIVIRKLSVEIINHGNLSLYVNFNWIEIMRSTNYTMLINSKVKIFLIGAQLIWISVFQINSLFRALWNYTFDI